MIGEINNEEGSIEKGKGAIENINYKGSTMTLFHFPMLLAS